jgi:ketosteroid isomerase-like protein
MTDHAAATLDVARAYHDAWTRRDSAAAAGLLAPDLVVEVPMNEYATRASFAEALAAFASRVHAVSMISEMSSGDEAMQLYDLQVDGLGALRVVEHLTVSDGRIVRVRHVHDTASLRAAVPASAS